MPPSSHSVRGAALRAVFIAASTAAACMEAAAQANNESATEAPNVGRLERVEVNARPLTATELRRQSTSAKQIFTEEDVQRFGDLSVLDVLKRLPGVSLSSGGPALRGLGNYTRILLNGEPAPPNFDLNNLNSSQVLRIEVTRAATADRTAEAIGGTINIVLKEPPSIRTLEAQARVSHQYDKPARGLNVSWGERTQGSSAFNLPLSYFEWRNFNAVTTTSTVADPSVPVAIGTRRSEQRPKGRAINFSPTLNWRVNDSNSLKWQAFISQGRWNWSDIATERLVTSGQPLFADDMRSFGTWLNSSLGTTFTSDFDGDQRLEVKANIQFNANDFTVRTLRNSSERRLTEVENRNPSFIQSGQYSRLVADAHTITVGWNLDSRDWIGRSRTTEQGVPLLPIFEGQDVEARVTRYALWMHDEWEVNKKLSAYAGIRGEHLDTKSRVLGETLNAEPATVMAPMFHLKYKIDDKAEHLFRSSLTRTFKAPELTQLLARPQVSGVYPDLNKPNDPLSSDRIGNPALKPELATGLDVAYERYFPGGGVASVTVFYRRVSDLIRNVTSLEDASWASVPRYVSRPTNFDSANTFGLELDARGRAGTLLPFFFSGQVPLDVRASLNFYESRVKGLPGPDNRLDRQQPWSATVGIDYMWNRMSTTPIRLGGNVSFTPNYRTQQTNEQSLAFARSRTVDLYANLPLGGNMSIRLLANNVAPVASESTAAFGTQSIVSTASKPRTWYGIVLSVKS